MPTIHEELFRRLVESVRDYAIFMLDPTGRVMTWNIGAERIKGYRADEIIGRHFSTFYPDAAIAAGTCERELELAAQDGRFEDEGWRVRKDGSQFWANVVITAVRDAAGELIGYAKVTRDLTDRKRAEEERAARLAAEQASRAKDEFMAVLGHELRNPMAPIVTALQLMKLRGGRASREQDVIERQVHHLVQLIDDLLDVARISRGKVVLDREPLDLRDVVANALETVGPMFEKRRHHVAVDAPSEPMVVDGDERRLLQVFSNLLTNAAKFTPVGGHIDIELLAAGDDMVVAVHDDGSGIDPAVLPRIFDRFVQGHRDAGQPSAGLGLGLSLVRSIVDLHGGRVGADSPGPGGGATFTVHLPHSTELADARALIAQRRLPPIGAPQRILVVDDNDDALEILVDALCDVGHDARGAHDPAAALAVVREFIPDIAILDIGLPVMDGYELAERLREQLGAEMPRLVALTGYGRHEDRARSDAAGFDRHLVKPIEMEALLATVRDLSRAA